MSAIVSFRPEEGDDEVSGFLDEVLAAVVAGKYSFTESATVQQGVLHKQDVVAAILRTKGVMVDMVPLLRKNRSTIHQYIWSNRDVLAVYDDVREGMVDQLERIAFEAAMTGDAAMVRYLLDRHGKHRGYTTRIENTGRGGGPVEVTPVPPKEALRTRLKAIADKNKRK